MFEAVQRAVEICDPDAHSEALAEFLRRYEDRDEPVTALGEERAREFFETEGELQDGVAPADPALTMAAAVATYLAYRRDELDDADADLLRLAARAEFGSDIPPDVADWLTAVGVQP
ncbi:MAG: hypothetical protein QOE31_3486 [Solirubrobacteraceae bacterium]|nr:hypothetical protein [Solirubrobacteraceae bacterium]